MLLHTIICHDNRQPHTVLPVTSHEFLCFFLSLRQSYKPAKDSTTVLYRGKNGLTNSQNLLFLYESRTGIPEPWRIPLKVHSYLHAVLQTQSYKSVFLSFPQGTFFLSLSFFCRYRLCQLSLCHWYSRCQSIHPSTMVSHSLPYRCW